MLKRDFILSIIEEIARTLRAALERLTGLRIDGLEEPEIAAVNEELLQRLDLNLERMAMMEMAELGPYLMTRLVSAENMSLLAEYTRELARRYIDTTQADKARSMLVLTLRILDAADTEGQALSISRIYTRQQVMEMMHLMGWD